MSTDAEVCDFFDRHLDGIAKAMKKAEATAHTCRYPPGKRVWMFSWRWPFVHTWISKAICCCDVNEILRGDRLRRESERLMKEIVEILER